MLSRNKLSQYFDGWLFDSNKYFKLPEACVPI